MSEQTGNAALIAFAGEVLATGRGPKMGLIYDLKKALERAEAQLAAVRAARANHPVCDKYGPGDVTSCGWKSVVQEIDQAMKETGR